MALQRANISNALRYFIVCVHSDFAISFTQRPRLPFTKLDGGLDILLPNFFLTLS